jgi:tight adherence protein B
MGLLVALVAATGTYLLYTAVVMGWRGLGLGPRRPGGSSASAAWRQTIGAGRVRTWAVRVGLADVRPVELIATCLVLALVGGLVGLAAFGALWPALAVALAVAGWPLASARLRRQRLLGAAQESWPRLIEEIRLRTTGLGRSVPQALFEAGDGAPVELRPAFAAAQREWMLSTDFERTIGVLKSHLADPTADAACETLLVAHEMGGTELDRRLDALIEDRVLDVQCRKDARSRQAGVRFARMFVLLVPCGMALTGMSIGTGREAYRTTFGQVSVVLGISAVAVCWMWAGRLLRLPDEERVFDT